MSSMTTGASSFDLSRKAPSAANGRSSRIPYQTATILVGSLNQLIITWLLYRAPKQLPRAARQLVARLMLVLELTEVEEPKKLKAVSA